MNVGSLFSGIGGFDLGFERAGMRTSWFCEQNDYCRRVINRHWPDVPIYPDVTELRGADVEPVDVLCGGFPCQDLSVAGKGAGLEGSRSGLWSQYHRLIGELRPRYVVVENVPALLGRGLGRVLGDLAQIGYDAEWDCIPASAFGAPHRRDRIWVVAYPSGESGRLEEHRGGGQRRESARSPQPALVRQGHGPGCPEGPSSCDRAGHVADAQGVGQREPADETDTFSTGRQARNESGDSGKPSDDKRRSVVNPDCERYRPPENEISAGWNCDVSSGWWEVEPDVGRVANGVPSRVDRLSALGNALVPQIAEWIGHRIVTYEANQAAVAAPKKEAA